MQIWRKIGGVALILVGFLALVTPFTPGSWLMFVGLELIGVRLAAWDSVKKWIAKRHGVHVNNTDSRDTEKKI